MIYGVNLNFRAAVIFTVCIKASGNDLSDDHIYFADRIIVYSTGNFVGSAKK